MLDRSKARAVGPLPSDHPEVRLHKVGVLLINLGTPDATDPKSIR
ncbi:MAG: ferrochelatase, partial [Pseudomonadota bacterium]